MANGRSEYLNPFDENKTSSTVTRPTTSFIRTSLSENTALLAESRPTTRVGNIQQSKDDVPAINASDDTADDVVQNNAKCNLVPNWRMIPGLSAVGTVMGAGGGIGSAVYLYSSMSQSSRQRHNLEYGLLGGAAVGGVGGAISGALLGTLLYAAFLVLTLLLRALTKNTTHSLDQVSDLEQQRPRPY